MQELLTNENIQTILDSLFTAGNEYSTKAEKAFIRNDRYGYKDFKEKSTRAFMLYNEMLKKFETYQ